MSAITLGKLGALADLTRVATGLTASEVTRVVAFARAVHAERRGVPDAEPWASMALPCVEATAYALEHLTALDEMHTFLARVGFGDSVEISRGEVATFAGIVETLLDLLVAVDGRGLPHLAAALGAASDPPT